VNDPKITARYRVNEPVHGPEGDEWYNVYEPGSEISPNFKIASFFERMPGARAEAYSLCERLNLGPKADTWPPAGVDIRPEPGDSDQVKALKHAVWVVLGQRDEARHHILFPAVTT
jgi:hypothetical protein